MLRIDSHRPLLRSDVPTAETTVPKDATEIEPGVYRHTDSAGKTYIFRKTPFGIVKSLGRSRIEPKSAMSR